MITITGAAVGWRLTCVTIWSCFLYLGQIACAVLSLVLLLVSALTLYRLCLHPLSNVPGPRLAAISSAWYAYHVRNGHMLHLGKTLHKRYGPVVRVRPDEVWLASREACKIIYSEPHTTTRSPIELPDPKLTMSLQVPQTALKSPIFIVSQSRRIIH